uniref:RRM domain-containing protein n=1 Tax=Chromera velia CCMP2878 TaxID=1169474 RepID=A0A0G4HRK5_9ALVE|eukprot:Cvel_1291.t1-p1 / transcript=Cvel_1291.t1 / gene=Cvel_1291 / organism=Chromera_velia_CCMP2878 / gene_product=CUGBP Elav-like family member 3, putative / transcript_product=CUGBP Elav-like family member 3, putative / location=Cvel_scaffold43:120133-122670(+) / protein_length=846 / sequence_SO=supercontig / SO=protein_coding / is_pseudo=false
MECRSPRGSVFYLDLVSGRKVDQKPLEFELKEKEALRPQASAAAPSGAVGHSAASSLNAYDPISLASSSSIWGPPAGKAKSLTAFPVSSDRASSVVGSTGGEQRGERRFVQESLSDSGVKRTLQTWGTGRREIGKYVECVDGMGQVFYYNHETKTSTWEMPPEFSAFSAGGGENGEGGDGKEGEDSEVDAGAPPRSPQSSAVSKGRSAATSVDVSGRGGWSIRTASEWDHPHPDWRQHLMMPPPLAAHQQSDAPPGGGLWLPPQPQPVLGEGEVGEGGEAEEETELVEEEETEVDENGQRGVGSPVCSIASSVKVSRKTRSDPGAPMLVYPFTLQPSERDPAQETAGPSVVPYPVSVSSSVRAFPPPPDPQTNLSGFQGERHKEEDVKDKEFKNEFENRKGGDGHMRRQQGAMHRGERQVDPSPPPPPLQQTPIGVFPSSFSQTRGAPPHGPPIMMGGPPSPHGGNYNHAVSPLESPPGPSGLPPDQSRIWGQPLHPPGPPTLLGHRPPTPAGGSLHPQAFPPDVSGVAPPLHMHLAGIGAPPQRHSHTAPPPPSVDPPHPLQIPPPAFIAQQQQPHAPSAKPYSHLPPGHSNGPSLVPVPGGLGRQVGGGGMLNPRGGPGPPPLLGTPPVPVPGPPGGGDISQSQEMLLGPQQKAAPTADIPMPVSPLAASVHGPGGGDLPGLAASGYGVPGTNLFVFHLPDEWTDSVLAEKFSIHGRVVRARVQTSQATGKSRGFGFVCMDCPLSAARALVEMNGFRASGKRLSVHVKKGEEEALSSAVGAEAMTKLQESSRQNQKRRKKKRGKGGGTSKQQQEGGEEQKGGDDPKGDGEDEEKGSGDETDHES